MIRITLRDVFNKMVKNGEVSFRMEIPVSNFAINTGHNFQHIEEVVIDFKLSKKQLIPDLKSISDKDGTNIYDIAIENHYIWNQLRNKIYLKEDLEIKTYEHLEKLLAFWFMEYGNRERGGCGIYPLNYLKFDEGVLEREKKMYHMDILWDMESESAIYHFGDKTLAPFSCKFKVLKNGSSKYDESFYKNIFFFEAEKPPVIGNEVASFLEEVWSEGGESDDTKISKKE